jgi:hypothetical protein
MFNFENGIPMPTEHKRSKYTFLNEMKIGQSFVVPIGSSYSKEVPKWRNQFMYRKWKCSIRRIDNNNIRIWRTE